MDVLKGRIIITTSFQLNLTEEEARALDAITGYGLESFLKIFYAHLGRYYLEPHEAGVKSLFEGINRHISPGIAALDKFKEEIYLAQEAKNNPNPSAVIDRDLWAQAPEKARRIELSKNLFPTITVNALRKITGRDNSDATIGDVIDYVIQKKGDLKYLKNLGRKGREKVITFINRTIIKSSSSYLIHIKKP